MPRGEGLAKKQIETRKNGVTGLGSMWSAVSTALSSGTSGAPGSPPWTRSTCTACPPRAPSSCAFRPAVALRSWSAVRALALALTIQLAGIASIWLSNFGCTCVYKSSWSNLCGFQSVLWTHQRMRKPALRAAGWGAAARGSAGFRSAAAARNLCARHFVTLYKVSKTLFDIV